MPLSEPNFEQPISPEILAQIAGRDLLIEQIGHWPKFDDFEVLSITLDRAPVTATVCDLRATFMVFDINKSRRDPDRRQGNAEFLFESVDDLKIEGFNHQNPILGISITPFKPAGGRGRFCVAWGGTSMTHEVSFSCGRIAVLRVMDLNPFRWPIPDPRPST